MSVFIAQIGANRAATLVGPFDDREGAEAFAEAYLDSPDWSILVDPRILVHLGGRFLSTRIISPTQAQEDMV